MIRSLFNDGTRSLVMIVNGINNDVTETEETQDDIDYTGERTGKVAEAGPKSNTDDFNHVT